jgi:hypothetical protein
MKKISRERGIKESLLSQIWQHQLIEPGTLVGSHGEAIRIISPGKLNENEGPDFGEALIEINGQAFKGDVELHLAPRQWREHGHQQDPNYNGVILHVVMWQGQEDSHLFNGKRVPTLALHPYLASSLEELTQRVSYFSDKPCHPALPPAKLAELLNQAGEERFKAKAERILKLWQSDGKSSSMEKADQVLYQGIMEALGYARNQEPFRNLAQKLPLWWLEELILGQPSPLRLVTLQALLFGMAGLLPRQRVKRSGDGDHWEEGLERLWDSFAIKETMNETEWHFFKVRPANFPSRRLAAASYLLTKYLGQGLSQDTLRLVSRFNSRNALIELERSLLVVASGYWANHFDFGVSGWNPTLIGWGRAREIVVNILLPFCFAWAELAAEVKLKNRVLELYHSYPKLAQNRLTKYMEVKLFPLNSPQRASSACQQQGLIHLYQTYCLKSACHQCPLSKSL